MRNVLFLVATLFCLFSTPLDAQEWVKQDLRDIATLSFPGEPEAESDGPDMQAYNYLSDNGLMYVVVQRMDMIKDLPADQMDEFYDGFIRGFVGSLEREAGESQVIKEKSHEGRAFVSTKEGAVDHTHYHRVFVIDDVVIVYNYALLDADNKETKKERETFFKSFSFK
ncbi:MAG: hypothetical protein JNL02_15790 [Saprospiraceae bacterium]|nr:hypothetical protein [Saprospiraceae bacterium]